MQGQASKRFRFGDCELDEGSRRLVVAGEPCHLTAKATDLLLYFVTHPGQVLSSEDIKSVVWPGVTYVDGGNIRATVRMIRKVLGDGRNGYIETVLSGGGYRLSVPVTAVHGTNPPPILPESTPRPARVIYAAGLLAVAVLLLLGVWVLRSPRKGEVYYYNLALRYEWAGNDEESLVALDRAIQVNSNFADAYLKAAFIADQIEQDDRADEYLKGAERLINTRDERFRLKVEGLRQQLDGQEEKALERYQLLRDRFPKDVDAQLWYGSLASEMNRLNDARDALTACLRVESDNPFCYFELMQLDLLANNFDSVLRTNRELSARGIRYPYFNYLAGAAFLGKDDVSRALQLFEVAKGSQTSHGRLHFRVAKDWTAGAALYQGKVASAKKLLEQAMSVSGSAEEHADYLLVIARTEMLLGRKDQARSAIQNALTSSSSKPVKIGAAIALAHVGAREEVEKLFPGLAADDSSFSEEVGPANAYLIKGYLALSTGDMRQAVDAFSNSYAIDEEPQTADVLAQAYMESGDLENASKLWESVITAKGRALLEDDPSFWPLANYYLAVCYQKIGNREQATRLYSHFLELWREADPELSQVAEARRELAVLPSDDRRPAQGPGRIATRQ